MGFSQGTTQMFYSLAHLDETFHKDNLYKAIMLAPCVAIPEEDEEFMNETLMTYQQDIDLYAYNGPNWESDYKRLCETYDEDVCEYEDDYDPFAV